MNVDKEKPSLEELHAIYVEYYNKQYNVDIDMSKYLLKDMLGYLHLVYQLGYKKGING